MTRYFHSPSKVAVEAGSHSFHHEFTVVFSTGFEVTHHWGNRFCHLVAAVIGDSLHLSRWDSVAEQLIARDLKPLKKRLRHCGSEDWQHLATVFTYFL